MSDHFSIGYISRTSLSHCPVTTCSSHIGSSEAQQVGEDVVSMQLGKQCGKEISIQEEVHIGKLDVGQDLAALVERNLDIALNLVCQHDEKQSIPAVSDVKEDLNSILEPKVCNLLECFLEEENTPPPNPINTSFINQPTVPTVEELRIILDELVGANCKVLKEDRAKLIEEVGKLWKLQRDDDLVRQTELEQQVKNLSAQLSANRKSTLEEMQKLAVTTCKSTTNFRNIQFAEQVRVLMADKQEVYKRQSKSVKNLAVFKLEGGKYLGRSDTRSARQFGKLVYSAFELEAVDDYSNADHEVVRWKFLMSNVNENVADLVNKWYAEDIGINVCVILENLVAEFDSKNPQMQWLKQIRAKQIATESVAQVFDRVEKAYMEMDKISGHQTDVETIRSSIIMNLSECYQQDIKYWKDLSYTDFRSNLIEDDDKKKAEALQRLAVNGIYQNPLAVTNVGMSMQNGAVPGMQSVGQAVPQHVTEPLQSQFYGMHQNMYPSVVGEPWWQNGKGYNKGWNYGMKGLGLGFKGSNYGYKGYSYGKGMYAGKSFGRKGSGVCFRCQQPGHMARECTSPLAITGAPVLQALLPIPVTVSNSTQQSAPTAPAVNSAANASLLVSTENVPVIIETEIGQGKVVWDAELTVANADKSIKGSVEARIDSGAHVSHASREMMEKLEQKGYAKKLPVDQNTSFITANGETNSENVYEMLVGNKENQFQYLKFYVLPNFPKPLLIGGIDFKCLGFNYSGVVPNKKRKAADEYIKPAVHAISKQIEKKSSEESVAVGPREAKLPWKSNARPDLNYNEAYRRLFSTMKSIQRKSVKVGKDLNKSYWDQFDDYEKSGFIERSTNIKHYIAHFPVFKESAITTKLRPVFDSDLLNKFLKYMLFVDPELLKILHRFRKSRKWKIFDLMKAFLQIKFSAADSEWLGFLVYKDGEVISYRWVGLPFGLTISPAFLQANVKNIIASFKEESNCDLLIDDYMDDIFCLDPEDKLDDEEFKIQSEKCMDSFIKNQFPLQKEKTISYRDKGVKHKILGMRVNEQDEIYLGKIEAEKLVTKRDAFSIFGMLFDPLCLYGELDMNSKVLAKELTSLQWDDNLSDKQIYKIREWQQFINVDKAGKHKRLIEDDVIICFVDASQTGMGVVCLDKHCTRVLGKNAIWNNNQSKWTVPKKELYSLLQGKYLCDKMKFKKVIYLSDSEINVQRIKNKNWDKKISEKEHEWLNFLVDNDLDILHIKSEWNVADPVSRGVLMLLNPDLIKQTVNYVLSDRSAPTPWKQQLDSLILNRAPVKVSEEDLISKIKEEQIADANIKRFPKVSNHFITIDKVIYLKSPHVNKLVLTDNSIFAKELISMIHSEALHCGVRSTYDRVKLRFHMKNLFKRVKEVCDQCLACRLATAKQTHNNKVADVNEFNAIKPWQVVGIDLVGPLVLSGKKDTHLFTVTDRYSRFTLVRVMKDTSHVKIMNQLDAIWNDFGKPEVIVSDNGTNLVAKELLKYYKDSNIIHKRIPVESPYLGGFYERPHGIITRSLLCAGIEGNIEIYRLAGLIQAAMNNRNLSKVDHITPYEILFGRCKAKDLSVDFRELDIFDLKLTDMTDEWNSVLVRADQLQAELADRVRVSMINKSHLRSHEQDEIEVGDKVYLFKDSGSKLKCNWKGPYVVEEVSGDYKVEINNSWHSKDELFPVKSVLDPVLANHVESVKGEEVLFIEDFSSKNFQKK